MALILSGAGGNADIQSFTVQGKTEGTFGTNFTVGKRYVLVFCDGTTGGASTLTGANIISHNDGDYHGTTIPHIYYVEATATTISYTTASYHSSVVLPYEITEM